MAAVAAMSILLSLIILDGMVSDWGRLSGGVDNLVIFFHQSLWPPDWSVLEPQVYPVCTARAPFEFTCSTAWIGVIETLKIAFVSTVFGMILSLPLSLSAARNLSPKWLSYISRFIISGFRSLPSLIWAIFFVILIGLGPLAGVLAMSVYTVGYLGKLQYESIEGLNRTPLEAAEAMKLTAKDLLKFTKANMLKLEINKNNLSIVKYLSERKLNIIAHIGVTPQSFINFNKIKVVGKTQNEIENLLYLAVNAEKAGAKAILLECIIKDTAKKITSSISIPTIGIGSSNFCDGQVLVFDDMINLDTKQKLPKFVKKYMNFEQLAKKAVKNFSKDVKNKKFPNKKYTYN